MKMKIYSLSIYHGLAEFPKDVQVTSSIDN